MNWVALHSALAAHQIEDDRTCIECPFEGDLTTRRTARPASEVA